MGVFDDYYNPKTPVPTPTTIPKPTPNPEPAPSQPPAVPKPSMFGPQNIPSPRVGGQTSNRPPVVPKSSMFAPQEDNEGFIPDFTQFASPEQIETYAQQVQPVPVKNTSVLSQTKDMFWSAPQGATEFISSAIQEPSHWVRGAYDSTPFGSNKADRSGNWFQDIQAGFREYSPLVADLSSSFKNSANVFGIGEQEPIWDRYKTASDEGTIVQTGVEDIANLGAVGGIIAKLLGRTGKVVQKSTGNKGLTKSQGPQVGGQTSNRPLQNSVPREVSSVPKFTTLQPVTTPGSGIAGYLNKRGQTNTSGVRDWSKEVTSANRVEAVGEVARKVSLGAELIDPADALLTGVGKGIAKLPVVGPKIVDAVRNIPVPFTGDPSKGQPKVNWGDWRKNRANASDAVLDMELTSEQYKRGAESTQIFVDKQLKDAGYSTEQRDRFGGVVLAYLSRDLDPILNNWENVPQENRVSVLQKFNETFPEDTKITLEELETFIDFESGALPDNVTEILNETIYRQLNLLGETTAAKLDAGVLQKEQLATPTVSMQVLPDGRFIQDLDAAEAQAILDEGPIEFVEIPTNRLSVEQVELAIKEGRADSITPFLPEQLAKKREQYQKERELLTGVEDVQGNVTGGELATVNEQITNLSNKVGVSEAVRKTLDNSVDGTPFNNTIEGRQTVSSSAKTRYENLQGQLDALLEDLGTTTNAETQAFLKNQIDQLDKEMIAVRNSATRAELEAIENGEAVVEQLMTLTRARLLTMGKEKGVVGRHKMTKRSLAEALNPSIDPSIRAEADANIAGVQEQINSASTLGIESQSIADALNEQQIAVEEAVDGIGLGVNPNPNGMWFGEQVSLTEARNPKIESDPMVPDEAVNPLVPDNQVIEDAPYGRAQSKAVEQLMDPKIEDFGDHTTEYGENPFPPDEEFGFTPAGIDPPANTTLAGSRAAEVYRSNALFEGELQAALREKWIIEERIASIDRRSENLERNLNTQQQDFLRVVNQNFVNDLKNVVANIQPNGAHVGVWKPSENGPGGNLTGIIGELAEKYGITNTVITEIGDLQKDMRVQERNLRSEFKQKNPGPFDDPEYRIAEDIYVKNEMPRQDVGGINIAARAFQMHMDKGLVQDGIESYTVDIRDTPDANRFYEALTADELTRGLERFSEDTSMMMGFGAFEYVQSELMNLPDRTTNSNRPNMKEFGFTNEITQAIDQSNKQFVDNYNRKIDNINNEASPAIPAPYRAPIVNARRYINAQIKEIISERAKNTPEGRAVAEALELVIQDTPSSFMAYARNPNLPVPQHVIGGSLERGTAKNATTNNLSVVNTKSENRKRSMARVRTLREYSTIEAREMTQLAINQGVKQIANNPTYSKSLIEVIGDNVKVWFDNNNGPLTYEALEAMANEAGFSIVEGVTPDDRAKQTLENRPELVKEYTDASGTDRTYAMVGFGMDIELSSIPELADRAYRNGMNEFPDIRVLPTILANEVKQYRDPKSTAAGTWYDQTTQLWKIPTLAWSPAWITYNATGNALMAQFSAGKSPVQVVKRLIELKNTANELGNTRGNMLENVVPERLNVSNQSWEQQSATRRTMQGDQSQTKTGRALDFATNPDRSAVGRATTFMYNQNAFVDNWLKSAVYLEELDRRLPAVPKTLLNPDGSLIPTDKMTEPQLAQLADLDKGSQVAQEKAVKATLNTMGDFTRLSPWERKYIKRALPFWPWLRHQTSMALRMPLSSPLRFAFLASLDNIIGQDNDPNEVQSLMGRFMQVGNSLIPLSAANPFASGLTAFANPQGEGGDIFTLKNLYGSANPIPKFAITALTGITGQGKSGSRPFDERSMDGSGKERMEGPVSRGFSGLLDRDFGKVQDSIGEFAYQALGQTAPTRGIRNLILSSPALGGDQRPRYDSGKVIENAQNRSENLATQIGNTFRIPGMPRDISYQLQKAKERDAELEYEELLKRQERRISDARAGN